MKQSVGPYDFRSAPTPNVSGATRQKTIEPFIISDIVYIGCNATQQTPNSKRIPFWCSHGVKEFEIFQIQNKNKLKKVFLNDNVDVHEDGSHQCLFL